MHHCLALCVSCPNFRVHAKMTPLAISTTHAEGPLAEMESVKRQLEDESFGLAVRKKMNLRWKRCVRHQSGYGTKTQGPEADQAGKCQT